MPSVLELTSGAIYYRIESVGVLEPNDGLVQRFIRGVAEFNTAIPLTSLEVKPLGGGVYKYTFNVDDGRKWKQNLRPVGAVSADCLMDFSVQDEWKLSEFTPHRVVRDAIIDLIYTKGVTSIDVTYD